MSAAMDKKIAVHPHQGARPMRWQWRCRLSGTSIIELMIVIVLLAALALGVGVMVARAQKAQRQVINQSMLAVAAQDILEKIRKEVSSSVLLLPDGLLGQEYFAGLDKSAALPLASSRLPVLSTTDTFRKDQVGAEKTGNILLYAFHDRTDVFDVGTDVVPKIVRNNIYRIVAWYFVQIPGKDPTRDVAAFDLVHWVSEPLVDLDQVDKLVNPLEKIGLLSHLFAGSNPEDVQFPYPPARFLWRRDESFFAAFQEFSSVGTIVPLAVPFTLPMSVPRSRTKHLSFKRLAIAANIAGPNRGLANFGLLDNTGTGFPHGLEFQLIGPASARQVLIHLTLCSDALPSEQVWLNLQGIAAARDF